MSSMLQALRERRCVEDAQENAWKTRAKIWVDAQVCLARNQAEAENGNWIEIHFENSATQTWKTDHSRTYCCFKSRAPHDRPADLISRSKRQFIPAPEWWTDTVLYRKSPQFRIAHVQHFESLKSDFPVLDKTIYHEINKVCLGLWEWAWDAFKNGFSSPMKIFVKSTSRSQRKNAIRTKFFARARMF